MVRIGWEPTLDLGRKADPALGATRLRGELAFLAPLPTDAAGAPAESAILRQHRQHRLHLKRLFQSGPRMAQSLPMSIVADAADDADSVMGSVLAHGRYPDGPRS